VQGAGRLVIERIGERALVVEVQRVGFGPFLEHKKGLAVELPRGGRVAALRKPHVPLLVVRHGEVVLCRPGIGLCLRNLFVQQSALVVEPLACGQVARPYVQFRALRVVACELTAILQSVRLGWRE